MCSWGWWHLLWVREVGTVDWGPALWRQGRELAHCLHLISSGDLSLIGLIAFMV